MINSREAGNENAFKEALEDIQDQLAQLQYGSLEISVHNGQIVQIERREKKRYEKRESAKPAS